MRTLRYDGSFEGFLSSVFYVFEYKVKDCDIQPEEQIQTGLFGDTASILTESAKAKRVWNGLCSKLGIRGSQDFYRAFLSEQRGIENVLLRYAQYAFGTDRNISQDFANPDVLKVSQVVKMVGREKHRMEAFVRFRLATDGLYFATIEPDFNVLPLIAGHYKDRYADQKWLIYDLKRHYGLFYDLMNVESVQMSVEQENYLKTDEMLTESEKEFQLLWKDYFKSANIASRKNTKLHLRHMPKRYWKYLIEKHP